MIIAVTAKGGASDDMERMTKKIGDHIVFPSELVGVELTPDDPTMHSLLERLSAYEDTGLMPEEAAALQRDWNDLCTVVGECGGLDRLRELAKADKDVRVVKVEGVEQ